MRTLIVYHSSHHGNTKKLLDAIAAHNEVTLLPVGEAQGVDLSSYEGIGLASGIYYGSLSKAVLQWAAQAPLQGKKLFFLYTCGMDRKKYIQEAEKIAKERGAQVLGHFGCRGYDTFGLFKLVGGIAKGRPNQADMDQAVAFYRELCQK